MPEYPEMATYTKMLRENLLGLEIRQVEVEREKSINLPILTFRSLIEGQRVQDIRSRGKQILFQLTNQYTGIVHLMLGGWMFFSLPEKAPDRTKQLTFSFSEKREQLHLINLRLGYFHLLSPKEIDQKLAPLGPEAIDPQFTVERWTSLAAKSKGNLKAFFLDQKKIAGIGNAYSDEICFEAELNPERVIGKLELSDLIRLYDAMHHTLRKGVQYGGYMDYGFTPNDTITGRMNDHFLVYDREGQACFRCQAIITTQKLAGRTSYYCPQCQK
jgi:formamidopyrimidine-DNA glycosylase